MFVRRFLKSIPYSETKSPRGLAIETSIRLIPVQALCPGRMNRASESTTTGYIPIASREARKPGALATLGLRGVPAGFVSRWTG